MNSCFKFTLAALLTVASTSFATADELHLNDGSVVTGEVTQWSKDAVVITTSFAGDISIARTLIKQVVADDKVLVEVDTGDKVVGTLVVDKDKGQLLTGTNFGDLKVDMSRVTSILAADENTTTSVASTPGTAVVTPAQGGTALATATTPAFAPATLLGPASKWTARVEMGVDGATGNTERVTGNGRIQTRRTTDTDRLLLYLQGTYAKQNGARSANEIIGGADLEVDITKRLFAFGNASLEYDEFENLDMRALVAGGLGYFWIRETDQVLKTRAGLGYMHESFEDGRTDDNAILELGLEYMKVITPWLTYNHSTTIYPSLTDTPEFRAVMENAAELPITKDKDWKFRIGMRNSYDSATDAGVERLDTTYFANLVWDFK